MDALLAIAVVPQPILGIGLQIPAHIGLAAANRGAGGPLTGIGICPGDLQLLEKSQIDTPLCNGHNRPVSIVFGVGDPGDGIATHLDRHPAHLIQ